MLDTPTTESSAPVTMKPNSTLPNNNYGGSEVSKSPVNKDGLWCVYCKKTEAYQGDLSKTTWKAAIIW